MVTNIQSNSSTKEKKKKLLVLIWHKKATQEEVTEIRCALVRTKAAGSWALMCFSVHKVAGDPVHHSLSKIKWN